MANLMITTACNLRCAYCFGMEMVGAGHAPQTMSWEVFIDLLDWIDRGDFPELDVHLMGGEPTLHPRFGDMVRELARRGRKTLVFSNGAAPLDERDLRDSAGSSGVWVVNVNEPETYRDSQLANLEKNLRLLGPAAAITFNMTGPTTKFDHVLDYIERFSLSRSIKIGVALPTLGHQNVYAKRDEFGTIAARIMELARRASAGKISLEFECGVPYCLFTAEQHRLLGEIHVSHCGSRLDITPTGQVINCLPLCKVIAISYRAFADYGQVREWFRKALLPYASLGCNPDCPECPHLIAGRCRACLAYSLGQLNRVSLPAVPGSTDRSNFAARKPG
jgi:sulfatase maturation enzyme AslB (radical SAM superfamily)